MSPLNLSELVKGLMIVVVIAASMGKLPELKRWAAQEAFGVLAHHVQSQPWKCHGRGTDKCRIR